jgi:restriction endonuclease S subunit
MTRNVAEVPLQDLLHAYIGGLWGEDPGFSEVDVKVIRITELGAYGSSDLSTAATRSLTQKQVESRRLEEGDLVLEKSGGGPKTPVGRVALVGELQEDYICSNFMLLMRPKHDLVVSRYLHYFLTYLHVTGQTVPLQSASTNIRNISTPDYMQILVPLPDLIVQQQIVEKLDLQLKKVENAFKALSIATTKSHHLFLSALEDLISDCNEDSYRELGNCLEQLESKKYVQRGWSPQCLSHPQTSSDSWAVLKTTSVQHMRFEPQHNKELPESLSPKPHLEVLAGDFLMTTTGPRNRCGVVCYVSATPKRLIFSGKILRFRPDVVKLSPEWLELVLASDTYQKRLDDLKVGSSDSSVSIGNAQVMALMVPVPSLQQQKEYVQKLDQIKSASARFIRDIESESIKFESFRRSLLHAAFSINPESSLSL